LAQPVPAGYANPILIPIGDSQCAWEEIVGTIHSYFRIEREEPIRQIGNTLTDGNITTLPEVSPTLFEPWRHDTVGRDQLLENTLQTMRRRAIIHVTPAQGGHYVSVIVFKELEDLRRPEHANAGSATLRYDTTLTQTEQPITGVETAKNWIPRGRDTALEQQIIGDLLSRCGSVSSPVAMRGQNTPNAPLIK
jgi:hypothetical protein